MDANARANPASQPPTYPRRFSWPMRIFLVGFLFCLTLRCLSILFPMNSWSIAYGIEELPPPMPSLSEMHVLPPNQRPAEAAKVVTLASFVDYWKPWPNKKSGSSINTTWDGVKYAVCWLNYRLEFLENLANVHEYWLMYDKLYHEETYVRARLFYDDGSEVIVRQSAEPSDYTHFGHWFEERTGNHEYLFLDYNSFTAAGWYDYNRNETWGYCNMLAHRHAVNNNGSPLVMIVLFQVYARLAPPEMNAREHYQAQNALTASPPRVAGEFRSDPRRVSEQVGPDFYQFDAQTLQGGPPQ